MKIYYGKHGSDKRILYGLLETQVERAIKFGATTKQTDGYLCSYRELRIAYKKLDTDVYYVKTIYIG